LFGSQQELVDHYTMEMNQLMSMENLVETFQNTVHSNHDLHQSVLQSPSEEMNMNMVVPYLEMDYAPLHYPFPSRPIGGLDTVDLCGDDHLLYDYGMMEITTCLTPPPPPPPSPELYDPCDLLMTLDLITIMDSPIQSIAPLPLSPPPPTMALEVAAMGLTLAPPVIAPTAVSVKREELNDELDLELKI
jgi:hypothetical protein